MKEPLSHSGCFWNQSSKLSEMMRRTMMLRSITIQLWRGKQPFFSAQMTWGNSFKIFTYFRGQKKICYLSKWSSNETWTQTKLKLSGHFMKQAWCNNKANALGCFRMLVVIWRELHLQRFILIPQQTSALLLCYPVLPGPPIKVTQMKQAHRVTKMPNTKKSLL